MPGSETSLESLRARFRDEVDRYLPGADTRNLYKALEFSTRAHANQVRLSGEPYVTHCIQVALILLDLLRRGTQSVILEAALLHDVLEDNLNIKREHLEAEFGPEVALLVDGVTKIGGIPFRNPEAEQSENFRKMLLSMARDIRVILIKLGDRLHNMRTLEPLKSQRRIEIATETREIYVPLAHRLGIARFKWELEDQCFKYLSPDSYRRVGELVATKREERERVIGEIREPIMERLRAEGIRAEVTGRPKSFFSIWEKMERTGSRFDQLFDLLGVRVLTDTREECYRVLGAVHDMFLPVQDRFKDYIASPKSNMYQSLHTTVIGPQQRQVEIQIRTRQMHLVAEFGIAAHYRYKDGGRQDKQLEQKLGDLIARRTTEWQDEADDPKEFMRLLKVSLYQDEVFVFTPRGELKQLPRGATPIDFAYAVHTAVGNHCVGARVNHRLVPLRQELKSGDTVEILTSPTATPHEGWLQHARTSRARGKIRRWLQEQRRSDSIALGREILLRELKKRRRKLPSDDELLEAAQSLGLADTALLLAQLGSGVLSVQHVANRIYPEPQRASRPNAVERIKDLARSPVRGVRIQDITSLMIHIAQCCEPVPGDPIIGLITRGRGVSVHRQDCPNTLDDKVEPERLIEVSWDVERDRLFLALLAVHGEDRPSLLSDVAGAIARTRTNIRQGTMGSEDNRALGEFLILVRNLSHLERVRRHILSVKGVTHVERKQVIPVDEKDE